ncbi:MAG: SGNH/GDSL hydrolase family protein [Planctomycetes bacterium]|nr:SGNH/GDSL hydrolase family protein [Planctomycetota bacterium]
MIGARVARALLAVALACGAGEATVRFVKLHELDPPELLDEQRRLIGDLSEITWFFGREGQAPPPGSLTQIAPGGLSYGWYDRPRWAYFDALGCVEYRINSLGFRDLDFPLEKPAGEARVLAVGDSFTFAAGVNLADCWVQRLERKLAAARGAPVEVVNAGFARGFRPESYAAWLAEQGMRLDPDALIVGFCLNDIATEIPMWVPLAPEFTPWLGGTSKLLTEVQRALARWRGTLVAAPSLPIKAKRIVSAHADEWQRARDGLLSMRDQMKARDGRMVVAILPMFSQLASGYLFGELHALVRDFCAAESIECVDLLPAFLGSDERDLWVHPHDQHPNDVGQERIASTLAAWFADHPLTPR